LAKSTGRELKKRELILIDDTLIEIRCALWGEKALATNFNWHENPLLALKEAKVSDYGGKSLSAGMSLSCNPDIPEAHALHAWKMQNIKFWQEGGQSLSVGRGGMSQPILPLEQRSDLSYVCDTNNIPLTEKHGLETTCTVTITNVTKDRDHWYESCPNCRKKVSSALNGLYCEKCQKDIETSEYRYVMNIQVSDSTSQHWVSVFNDEAKFLLGILSCILLINRCYLTITKTKKYIN
jgi:replication factor A1